MSNEDLIRRFGKRRVEVVRKRIAEFVVETPSWGYGRGGSRFATYHAPGDPRTVEAKFAKAGEFLRRTGKSKAVALHFPWDGANMAEVRKLKKVLKKNGLEAGAVNANLFTMRKSGPLDARLRFGSMTSPLAEIRKASVGHNLECMKYMRQLGSKCFVLWLPDGTNSPGQLSLFDQAGYIEETVRATHAALRAGEAMLIEYKFFEPGFYSTAIPSWGRALQLCKTAGPRARVLVDLGHHPLGANIEQIVALLMREKRLGGFHFNDHKYADDDLATGSIDPAQLFRIFCVLVEGDRRGIMKIRDVGFMIDQSHMIKDPLEELIESLENILIAYAKALLVDFEKLRALQLATKVSEADALLRDAFLTDVRSIIPVGK
jgi:L-rhamnose isomerase/sugar isomerase